MKLKERAKKLKADIPAVFIALSKKETPLPAKLLAGLAVAYALSPIDLIPDFIPVLGLLDDVLLLPVLIALTVKLIPPEIFAQCREQALGMAQKGLQKKWYFAVPIILIWSAAIALILLAVL